MITIAGAAARLVVRRKRHLTLLRTDAEVATPPPPTPAEELEEKELDAFRNRYVALARTARQSPQSSEDASGTPEVD